ncbi:MAG TPA: type II secretion system protein [Chthoniobacteraceae bacterium]|jgi:prepilin-type N-terminal cleavage/methylation domain-containing protein|nr:type II secretion system protein [Chthoniobacteraceae bacterium]
MKSPTNLRTLSRLAGMTLVEVLIALMVLAITASSILMAFAQINRVASTARLYAAAEFLVQSYIDRIQMVSPFVPENSSMAVPAELTLSGTTYATPLYVDPATNSTIVTGTVSCTGSNISSSSANEYAYQYVVTVTYTYRSHLYTVSASTVRGSDQ